MRRALEFGLWLVVLALPVELFFRVTGLGAAPRLAVHESGLLEVMAPGSRVVFRREGFSAFEVNEAGLRGPARGLKPAPGERRVAVLGDSYVEALQVATEATLVARFEAGLQARWPAATALNFGLSGESLAREVVRYRAVVRPRDPQLVVVVATDGDLRDVIRDSEGPPYRFVDGDVVVAVEALPWNDPRAAGSYRRRQWLRDRLGSYAVAQRFRLLVEGLQARWRAWRGGGSGASPDAEQVESVVVPAGAVARYAALLRRLKAEVEADGGRLVGVHVPKGFTLRDANPALRDAFREAFAAAEVPFVSSYDALRAAYAAQRWTHFGQPRRGGGHLSEVGHAVVAEVMLEALWAGPWRGALGGPEGRGGG